MRVGALLAAALLAACGARSELRVGPAGSQTGPGGAGGMGGAGGAGAAGGAGGMGGSPGCVLQLVEPISILDGGDGWHQRQPEMTFSSDDRSRVTVAAEWAVTSVPDPPSELRHTSFFPWDDWSPDGLLGPSYLADFDGGASFAVAAAPGELLALAFTRPGAGLWYSPEFIPEAGFFPPLVQVEPAAERVLFAAEGPTRHLIGVEHPRVPPNMNGGFETTFISPTAGGPGTASLALGCSATPASADAALVGERWILAFASGSPDSFVTCATDTVPGPPARLELLWTNEAITDIGLGEVIEAAAPITRVQVAPQPDGAWVVYTHPTGGGTALVAARVDGAGVLATSPAVLTEPAAPISFSADAMGEWLALAWSGELSSAIVVTLVDRDGVIFSGAQVPTDGQVVGAPSVLGRPDGRGLLVAWSEASPVGDRVRVARLDCEGGGI